MVSEMRRWGCDSSNWLVMAVGVVVFLEKALQNPADRQFETQVLKPWLGKKALNIRQAHGGQLTSRSHVVL